MLQGTSETDEVGTSRAKSLLLKKKLDDKDRIIKEKEEEVELKEQHVVAKEKIIAEREEIIKSLTTQLEDKNKMMEEYQQSREPAGDTDDAEVSCTVKPVLSSHSKGTPKMGFQYQLSLNAGQKYCRMLQEEHSAILSTFIKLPFDFKTFVSSIFEWPL